VGYRSEAKGVPHILVGPNQAAQLEEANSLEGEEDEDGGYFEDGAFIAVSEPAANPPASTDAPPDAQEAYYISLASRLKELRIFLQKTPPLTAIEALTSDHPISLPPDSAKAQQQWRFLLQSQEPQMAQLACMDMGSILEVVKLLKSLLAGTVRSRSQEKIERLGAWIWGILGRCNEAGQLGSEEISELRELGKRAVGLLVGIRDRSGMSYGNEDEEDQVIEDEQDANGGKSVTSQTGMVVSSPTANPVTATANTSPETVSDVSELERAKAMLQEKLNTDDHPQSNGTLAEEGEVEEDRIAEGPEIQVNGQILATLEMIITIVGEFYGQRDLLEFRDIWNGGQSGFST
jgi:regulator of vacuolar morphogenesis